MFKAIKGIFQYRDLLVMLTMRDLRVRYKQAAMGFLWAVFMPIVAVCAGILIKKAMAVVSQKPLEIQGIISIIVKTLPWTFFISSIRFAVQALVGNSSLVTKIYFPRAVLVFASILACLFDFSVALVVAVILLAVFQVGVSIYLLWVPLLVLLLILYTIGLGLILSSANLFYRDVKYVVEILLMFGIFFTPVFYNSDAFGRWEPLMLINPLGSILEALRSAVVLHQMPDIFWLNYAVVTSLAAFWFGMYVFHKKEPLFAENI
ncbi:MAG: ABC transporter permease [Candidatus Omnitrophota bacterium]|nr:ABC transporter permease [Candidatus Omnitrophota bacterium]